MMAGREHNPTKAGRLGRGDQGVNLSSGLWEVREGSGILPNGISLALRRKKSSILKMEETIIIASNQGKQRRMLYFKSSMSTEKWVFTYWGRRDKGISIAKRGVFLDLLKL
jgi:hypothetical protein